MPAPQGLIEFPGLPVITSGDFTLSHGILPSVLSFNTVPSTNFIPQVGDMKITFDGKTITFKECGVVAANLRVSGGGYLWSISIQDRRWKWRNGRISGHYNVRRDDQSIDPKYEKKPQELAKLLLKEMNEEDADVSKLPNDARPECVWDGSNPASELQNLCDALSCRIVLGTNNKVTLWPLGQGKQLPANGKEMNQGYGFKRNIRPDSLEVLGGPILIQAKFILEAVGEDTDGTIKPIDRLSYKPVSGWESEYEDLFANVTGTYTRDGKTLQCSDLAAQCVWKMYRLVKFADDTFNVPGLPDAKVTKIQSLLPINDALVDMVTVLDVVGANQPRPIEVEGVWSTEGFDYTNSAAGTRFPGEFSVDRNRGILKFNVPVVKIKDDGGHSPADLFATVSFTVRDEETGAIRRHSVKRDLPGQKLNTKPRILNHPEIIRQIIARYIGTDSFEVEDNEDTIKAEADHYLDAAAKEYELEASSEVQYAGIEEIEPDGAIAQVTWSVGGSGATTRASRNAEHAKTDSYKERRRREMVNQAAEKQALMDRAQATGNDRWNFNSPRLA